MITKFKIFESVDNPKVGDYVLIDKFLFSPSHNLDKDPVAIISHIDRRYEEYSVDFLEEYQDTGNIFDEDNILRKLEPHEIDAIM